MNVLFATSEAYPLIKTGGLADVSASLPRALLKLGHQVRILMPAYKSALEKQEGQLKLLTEVVVDGQPIKIWQTRLPHSRVSVWLVDLPLFSERGGNPYLDEEGKDWPDNHRRFYFFCRLATELATGRVDLNWTPELVHCNDWQTGLIPALLSLEPKRPATVFTVHNLAYHGLFPYSAFAELNLPAQLWHHEALEFYQQLSFIKGGLIFADRITTVSPTYAKEIQTQAWGCGLEGVLQNRKQDLHGILNGIDMQEWNPGRDPHLEQPYSWRSLKKKAANKKALQQRLDLAPQTKMPLLGFVGRLVEQKGIDLLMAVLPTLLEAKKCQLVMLGSGAPDYQQSLKVLARKYPRHFALTLGYDEGLAHQIEAGADAFLMPSLFEPCGLNQLYSLRYGTPPIVHAVGGLRDTVVDISEDATEANGFCFYQATADGLFGAIKKALDCYRNPELWRQLQINGMRREFSWDKSAQEYQALYQDLVEPEEDPTEQSAPPPVPQN